MVKQNFLTKMLLLCALIVGSVSSAWAEDAKVTLDLSSNSEWGFPAGKSNIAVDEQSFTAGGYTIKVAGTTGAGYYWNNSGYLLLGKTGAYVQLPAFTFNVSKIKLTYNSGVSTSNKQNIFVGSTAVSTEATANGSNNEFAINENYQAAGNVYKIQVTTNNNCQLTKIEIFEAAGDDPSLEDSDFALDDDPITLDFDLYNNADAQVITYTTSSTGPVTIEDSEYATFSINTTAKTITVTPTAVTPSAQTITVNQAADETYAAGSVTFTVNITNSDPNVPGTLNNPYTVAQAIDATPSSGTSENVYIKGIVSSFYKDNSIVGDGSNYRYYISDDGTTTNQLLVYKGKGLNRATFSNTDDLLVGDKVVICGGLTTYNNTKEVAADNYIVSLERPTSISADDVTLEAEATAGVIVYTINNPKEGIDLTVSENVDWISDVTVVASENKVTFATTANTGEERSAIIVLTYGELTKDVTITQAAYVAPPTPVDGKYVKVTSTDDITDGQYLIVYEGGESNGQDVPSVAFNGGLQKLDAVGNGIAVTIDNNQIQASSTTQAAEFFIDATNGKLRSASGFYPGVTSYSNGLNQSDDPDKYTHNLEIKDGSAIITISTSDDKFMTLSYNYSSNQLRFRYYKDGGQQPIQLYKFVQNPVTVTIASSGYTTLSSAYALDFSSAIEGLEAAYVVSALTGTKASFTKISKAVPAETGLVLKGSAGAKVTIPFAASADELTETNYLKPCVNGGTVVARTTYAMSGGKFKLYTGTELPVGKAYLLKSDVDAAASNGQGAPELSFDFGEGTTGIQNIERTMNDNQYYTLDGRRVAQPTKGLYIVNGKKVLVP